MNFKKGIAPVALGLAAAAFSISPSFADAVAGAVEKQGLNIEAIVMFGVFVGLTLIITYVAAKRTKSASDFYAAGGGITGLQNGLAMAGDYMSAASFLGISGLVFSTGYDGLIYSVGWLVGWPVILFLIAERLRNLGKYTFADVASFRLDQTWIRILSAIGTFAVVAFYLIAQMVGAGKLIQLLFGLDYLHAVVIVGALMIVYVAFGGMKATTWVQIIKACLLLFGATLIALLVLIKFHFNPEALFAEATKVHPKGVSIMGPGNLVKDPISAISLGLALMFGTAGLPHILMRFFTVADAKAGPQIGVLRDRLHRLLLHPDLHHRVRRHRASDERSVVLQGWEDCSHRPARRHEYGGDQSGQGYGRLAALRLHLRRGFRDHPCGGGRLDARSRFRGQPRPLRLGYRKGTRFREERS